MTATPQVISFRPLTYFKTQTATPSATAATFGTQITFAPPAGFYLFITHLGLSTQAVSSETLTVRAQGVFTNGDTKGASTNYTTATGDIDPQNLLYGLADVVNGNTGQDVEQMILDHLLVDCESSKTSSTASVIFRVWGLLLPR